MLLLSGMGERCRKPGERESVEMRAALSADQMKTMDAVYTNVVDISAMYFKPAALKKCRRRKKHPGYKLLRAPRNYWYGEHIRA